jgi:hypothetical protein
MDRIGRRVILVGSMALLCPLLVAVPARGALAGDRAAGRHRVRG